MTKLAEWLCGLSLYFGFWILVVTKNIYLLTSEDWYSLIMLHPLYCIVLFGLYSLTTVLWRVYSFDDCPQAATELQQQIREAKEDLKLKGLKI